MKPIRLLPLVAALLVPALWMPPADADVSTHTDAARDVTWIPQGGGPPVPPTTAPARALGDITKIRVNHTSTQVRVLLTMRDLSTAGTLHEYYFGIRTGKIERQFSFDAKPGAWAGSAVRVSDASGNPLSCRNLQRTIDYRANTALVVIPRPCLGKPAFVRVLAKVSTVQYNRGYSDYAYIVGPAGNTSIYGPKIYQ